MSTETTRAWLRCYRCWSQDLEVQVHYEGIHKIDPETGERAEVVDEMQEAVVQCLDCMHDQPHLGFRDGRGSIGFINPVSEPFCGDCNRIRLTADGKLRTCLFSLNETDLRAPLREGASDADLEEIVRAAVWRKELKHRVNEPGFVQPARTMSAIGG